MNEDKLTMNEWHRKEAINSFNGTWDLIDKTGRSKDEELQMIHLAHASRYHWSVIGEALNLARGEWQISRVYALVGLGESALYHGKASLDYCLNNNIEDFDLAFAYESIARAYMVLGDQQNMASTLLRATDSLNTIKKVEDLDYVKSELSSIKL